MNKDKLNEDFSNETSFADDELKEKRNSNIGEGDHNDTTASKKIYVETPISSSICKFSVKLMVVWPFLLSNYEASASASLLNSLILFCWWIILFLPVYAFAGALLLLGGIIWLIEYPIAKKKGDKISDWFSNLHNKKAILGLSVLGGGLIFAMIACIISLSIYGELTFMHADFYPDLLWMLSLIAIPAGAMILLASEIEGLNKSWEKYGTTVNLVLCALGLFFAILTKIGDRAYHGAVSFLWCYVIMLAIFIILPMIVVLIMSKTNPIDVDEDFIVGFNKYALIAFFVIFFLAMFFGTNNFSGYSDCGYCGGSGYFGGGGYGQMVDCPHC